MKQNNSPENDMARATISEQKTGSEQIRRAKAKMLENARVRSEQRAGRKSMGAVTATPAQSEITDKAPQLYTPTKINVPADFGEVARLLFRELNNISQSQSYILTLWEKVKGQIADAGGITFTLPVDFAGGVTLNGITVTDWRFRGEYNFGLVPWNVDTGLYIEHAEDLQSADMIIHFSGGAGDSCPAMQFRVMYKNGGIFYRSARDDVGFEEDFIELATVTAVSEMREQLKAEIYAELRAAGISI